MAMVALVRSRPHGGPDRDRLFDVAFTTDPGAVREAARLCADTARAAGAEVPPDVAHELSLPPDETVVDRTLLARVLVRLLP
jgi:hypothetical protein